MIELTVILVCFYAIFVVASVRYCRHVHWVDEVAERSMNEHRSACYGASGASTGRKEDASCSVH